jgi:hypothetical protein
MLVYRKTWKHGWTEQEMHGASCPSVRTHDSAGHSGHDVWQPRDSDANFELLVLQGARRKQRVAQMRAPVEGYLIFDESRKNRVQHAVCIPCTHSKERWPARQRSCSVGSACVRISMSACVHGSTPTVSNLRDKPQLPHLVFPRHVLHPEPHGALAILHGGTRVQHLHQILPLYLPSIQVIGDADA